MSAGAGDLQGGAENRPHQANTPTAAKTSARPTVVFRLAFVAIVALGAVLRVVAARDEFWSDEIWSLAFAEIFDSPWEILRLRHDNNHPLITLWMWLVGSHKDWFIYRLPSVLAGIGTIVLSGVVARRWGQFASLAAALLTAASFMLITYASEARGYALAGFFSLTAFLALTRFMASGSIWANVAFCASVMLGALSHLTFVEFYAASVVWSTVRLVKTAPDTLQAARWLTQLHAVPALFLVAVYFMLVRGMVMGGGQPYILADVLAQAAALALGMSDGEWTLRIVALMAVLFAVAAIAGLRRARADEWCFFAVAIFVAPAILLLALRPDFLFSRYFFLNVLWALIAYAYLLARLSRIRSVGRILATLSLALAALANAVPTVQFLQQGRGHYREVLLYMADHTEGDVHFAGDGNQFFYELETNFFVPRLPTDRSFYRLRLEPGVEPEWLIQASTDTSPGYSPPEVLAPRDGRRSYAFERAYRHAGLTGFNYALYRRLP